MTAASQAWAGRAPRAERSALHPTFVALDAVLRPGAPWTPSERLVAVALARRLDRKGRAWPSQLDLARRTGFSERTVRRAILRLCAADGPFRRTRRGRRDFYTFRAIDGSRVVSAGDTGHGDR